MLLDAVLKNRDFNLRSKEFQIMQHRRAIDQLPIMIDDIELLAQNPDQEIRADEDRTKRHDPKHFAYPFFAEAAIQRRDNLRQSADRLKIQLGGAKKALSEAIEESEAIAYPMAVTCRPTSLRA